MTPPDHESDALSKLDRILAEKEAELAAKRAQSQPLIPVQPLFEDDLIPEVEEVRELSDFDKALDEAVSKLGIIEAYNRFCGKSSPGDIAKETRGGRKTEGVMVRCPNPAHPDVKPQAWMNTEKNLWRCEGCAMGGDVIDIAAWYFNYPVPGYKRDKTAFREVMLKLGQVLGVSKAAEIIEEIPAQREPEPEPEQLATVHKLPSALAAEVDNEERQTEQDERDSQVIDWRSFVPAGTFLRTWLEEACHDTSPEEYHFWTGLLAIGFAVGRHRTLTDRRPVVPNLFVCLVGPSGAGKSTAKAHLVKLIQEAIPYDSNNPLSLGTKFISSPGSAEYMVKALSNPVADPSDPKKVAFHAPVRAQVDFEELAALVNLGKRAGSNLKPVLLELYDASQRVGSGSLTHGEREAHNPFVQVTTTTQNGSLRGLLDRSDEISGFMNRWVFAGGRLKRQMSLGGTPMDVKASAAKLKEIHRWAGTTKGMSMTADAYAAWDEFFHDVIEPLKDASEKKNSAMLNRLDLLFKKLMVLFACNNLHEQIELADVEHSKLLLPYLLASFGVVNEHMEQTPENELTERLLAKIEKMTKLYKVREGSEIVEVEYGPTSMELFRYVKNGKIQDVTEVERLLRVLKNLGILREDDVRQVGAKKSGKRWSIVA